RLVDAGAVRACGALRRRLGPDRVRPELRHAAARALRAEGAQGLRVQVGYPHEVTASPAHFLELHHGDAPFLIPNAWDAGTAKLFQSLGAAAIATTSSGYAATLGRLDYDMTRAEALAHCRVLADAVTIPVSADFENGFADSPDDVAEAVREAKTTGI